MYREEFGADFVIDLVGYRRYGHNEGDEPSYTQPRMYETIRDHPSVRELYQKRLVEAGVVSAEEAEGDVKTATRELAKRLTAACTRFRRAC
jgi:2-oxoglutarate dehydrogenase E1 component